MYSKGIYSHDLIYGVYEVVYSDVYKNSSYLELNFPISGFRPFDRLYQFMLIYFNIPISCMLDYFLRGGGAHDEENGFELLN